MSLIDKLTAPGSSTNYDAAMTALRTPITTTTMPASTKNVLYFISDGEPNVGTGTTADAPLVSAAEERTWIDFLGEYRIDAYALGFGSGINATSLGKLDPIAYDGSGMAGGINHGAMFVANPNDLSAALAATVTKPVTGNIITSAAPGATFGDDGTGYVYTIGINSGRGTLLYDRATNTVRLNGTGTYTFDAVSHVVTVTDQSGYSLAINMLTGDYRVTPGSNSLGYTSLVSFSLRDASGAISGAWMTLGDDGARSETIITNTVGNQLILDDLDLLANDLDPRATRLSMAGILDTTDGMSFSRGGISNSSTNTAGADNTRFTYAVQGQFSTATDRAQVTIDWRQAGQSRLRGTGRDDIFLIDPAVVTITGGNGNDIIRGARTGSTIVVDTDDGLDRIYDSGAVTLKVTGGGEIGTLLIQDTASLYRPGGMSTGSGIQIQVGDTIVQKFGFGTMNATNTITQLQFDLGATLHGAALFSTYSLVSGSGFGIISRNTVGAQAGTPFDDILYANGAQTQNGGAGHDILIGGAGVNQMTGGAGRDVFVPIDPSGIDGDTAMIRAGLDRILDFTCGDDLISLLPIDANTRLDGDQAFLFRNASTTATIANTLTWSAVAGSPGTFVVRGDVMATRSPTSRST